MNREEMTQAIKECAAKLGRIPTMEDLQRMAGIKKNQIRKTIGRYKPVVAACGLEGRGAGHQVPMRTLFHDWAGVVRKLGKIPSVTEYGLHGNYTYRPLRTRYGTWHEVPAGMLGYAIKEGIEEEWGDVAEVITTHLELKGHRSVTANVTEGVTAGVTFRHRIVAGQPIYGRPMLPFALTYAPTNESGVIFLFGMWAERLGYAVTRIQAGFPDGEALREVGPNRWQRVRIEFEYESRNFVEHGHPVDGCDLIVCWSHNWSKCPVEVLELQKVILP